jgi:ubiquinone biosynthesis protein COQ9
LEDYESALSCIQFKLEENSVPEFDKVFLAVKKRYMALNSLSISKLVLQKNPKIERALYDRIQEYGPVGQIVDRPVVQAIPFRPIFYDLAFEGIQLPKTLFGGGSRRGEKSSWW